MVRTQAARTSLMLAKYDQILTDVIDMLDMNYDQQTIRDHINNAQAEIDNLSEM